MRKYILILLILLPFFPLMAQISEPEDPELVLPQMLLEIRELTEENVEALLPESSSILRTEISMPLPEVDSLEISGLSYDIPNPDYESAENTASSENISGSGNSFFSESVLGFGSMNQIMGQVTLYKLGSEPRFQIGFSHDGIDGYWKGGEFYPRGSGSYTKINNLQGLFSYEVSPFELQVQLDYLEVENGLQGVSTYTAAAQQFFDNSEDFSWQIKDDIDIFGSLDFHNGIMVLTGEDPVSQNDLNTAISGGLRYTLGNFDVEGGGGYYYSTTPGSQTNTHNIEAFIDLGFSFLSNYSLALDGNLYYRPGENLRYPFSLQFNGAVDRNIQFSVEGGYLIEQTSYESLWRETPLLDFGGVMDPIEGWYGKGGLQWIPLQELTLALDIKGGGYTGIPRIEYDTTKHLYDLTFREGLLLDVMTQVDWEFFPNLIWSVSWSGSFPGGDGFTADNQLDSDIFYQDSTGLWGLAAHLGHSFPMGDFTDDMPIFGISGLFNPLSNLNFTLEVNDILSLFMESGRFVWDEYHASGFNVRLETGLSL